MANKRQKKKQQKKLKNPSYTGYSSTNKYNDRDKEYYNKVQEEIEYQQRFSQGYMTYEELLSKVDEIRKNFPSIADEIDKAIDKAIATEGLEELAIRLGEADESLLYHLDVIIYGGSEGGTYARWYAHMSSILSIIQGKSLSAEQAKNMTEAFESDMDFDGV